MRCWRRGSGQQHLYEDFAWGRRDDRPGLAACLKALREGDVLVVWKLDRLGRDLRHLINTVHDLTTQGMGLKVLTGHGAGLDATTAAGKLVFGIFAALAEFERELIAERTRAGLAAARARGRKGGAPFKMTPAKLRLAMAAMGQPETKVSAVCKNWGSRGKRSTAMSARRGVTSGRPQTTRLTQCGGRWGRSEAGRAVCRTMTVGRGRACPSEQCLSWASGWRRLLQSTAEVTAGLLLKMTAILEPLKIQRSVFPLCGGVCHPCALPSMPVCRPTISRPWPYRGTRSRVRHPPWLGHHRHGGGIASDTKDRRPKRQALLTAARQRQLDIILVWKLDQWGRSLVDLMTTLHELTTLGVGFVSLTEALDLTTPGRARLCRLPRGVCGV